MYALRRTPYVLQLDIPVGGWLNILVPAGIRGGSGLKQSEGLVQPEKRILLVTPRIVDWDVSPIDQSIRSISISASKICIENIRGQ